MYPTLSRSAAYWRQVLGAAQAHTFEREAAANAEHRVARAAALMNALPPDTALDLDSLAKLACYSRYHFLREFKRVYGQTPHQYLTRVRLARAKMLLESTDRPVTEVCLDLGYSSLGSFSALFRREYGRSPSAHRRRFVQVKANLGVAPGAYIPTCFLKHFAGPSPLSNFREAPPGSFR